MSRYSSRAFVSIAVLAVVAAVSAGLSAQNVPAPGAVAASPTAAPATDSTPRTIRLDAIVTDKQGRPIVNLQPADFQILENGIAQTIDSADLMSRTAVTPSKEGPQSPAEHARSEGKDLTEEERAAREPGTRVIALYLDEFHVNEGPSTERVRQAVSRFVDEQLRPGDLVVIMKPLDHLTDIRFTRDRSVARTGVASFTGRKDDYTPRTTFEELYMGRSPGAVRAARAQIVMSGLRALTARVGELNAGLAGIVLISEGFDTELPRSRERRLPDPQGFVRAATRSRVLFYAFDPGSTQPAEVLATTSDGNAGASSISSLQAMAQQTGGEVVLAGQDLVPALQRVSRDLDAYYVLSYKTTSASDGRYHNVQVSSRRRGAQVRTRTGYWAPLPSELRATRVSAPPILSTRALRRSPFIDSWLGMTIDADGRRHVIFTWTPATGSTRSTKPLTRPEIVTVKVSTLSGSVLFEGDVTAARSGSSGSRTDRAAFLAGPGRLQFDFTVLQADGTKLDVGAQDYDVPEVRAGKPLILPPQLFRAASAREFREISADPNAAPLPGRDFRRTDRMLLRVPTYDPSGSPVQVSAKLINRVGSLVIDLTPMASEGGVTLSQFDLPLARFAPGEYSIEVSAQSTSGLVRELIRVRITG